MFLNTLQQQKKPPSIVETFQQQNINFRTDDNLDPQECLRKPEIDVVEEFQTSLKKTASDDQGRIAVNAELNGSPITIMFKKILPQFFRIYDIYQPKMTNKLKN